MIILAITKVNLSCYAGTIFDFNKGLETNPHDADSYYNRTITKMSLNELRGN